MNASNEGAANLTDSAAERNPIVENYSDDSRSWFVRPIWGHDSKWRTVRLDLWSHDTADPNVAMEEHCTMEILPRKFMQFEKACAARGLSMAGIVGDAVARAIADTLDTARAAGDIPPVQQPSACNVLALEPTPCSCHADSAPVPAAAPVAPALASLAQEPAYTETLPNKVRVTLEFEESEFAEIASRIQPLAPMIPIERFIEEMAMQGADQLREDPEHRLFMIRDAAERESFRCVESWEVASARGRAERGA